MQLFLYTKLFVLVCVSVCTLNVCAFRTLSSAGATNNEEAIAKVAVDTGAPTMWVIIL